MSFFYVVKKNKVLLFLFVVLFFIMFFEIIIRPFENLDFYSGATYTIDAENNYYKIPKKRVHIPSNIPGLSYELNPNINVVWQGANILTISFGVRDREFDFHKPDDTFRIVALGDSVTFGAGVDVNDTFLKILEIKLNKQNQNINYEVINGGVSAYNLMQKYIILESKLIKYNPDLVLINFVQDDYGPINVLKYSINGSEGNNTLKNKYDLFSLNMPRILPLPRKLNLFFLKHSAFYRFFNLKTYNILSKINSIKYPPEIYKLIGGHDSFEYNREAVDKLLNYSIKKNIPIIIVSFPNLVNDNTINDKWIITYPSHNNMTVIDLFPLLIKKEVDFESVRLSPSDYAHFNKKGHNIIGEILYEELTKYLD